MGRRAKGIYKRKDGRYEARYIKGYGEDGRAQYGAVYAHSYNEVKGKLSGVMAADKGANERKMTRRSANRPGGSNAAFTADAAVPNAAFAADADVTNVVIPGVAVTYSVAEQPDTVNEAVEAYLASIKDRVKPVTHNLYCRCHNDYIKPFFGDTSCDGVTNGLVQGFVEMMERDVSASAAVFAYRIVKTALKRVVPRDVLEVGFSDKTAPDVEVLTVDEQRRLEAAIKRSDDIDRIGMMVALYTGIRIGELCGLRWEDVDFARRALCVNRSVQRVSGDKGNYQRSIGVQPLKYAPGFRRIPLPEFLVELLRKHRRDNAGEYMLSVSLNGAPITMSTMRNRLKALLQEAGVRNVGFSALRDTFAVRALEAGFDVTTLTEILGHRAPEITLAKYAVAVKGYVRVRVDSLAAL